MAENTYSYQGFDPQTMARAKGSNLKISFKKSVDTLKAIRGKKVSSAISYLEQVKEQKSVVPYKRFNKEMPHKRGKGVAAGGYPVNVAEEILAVLKNAQSNAGEQELSQPLYIINASAKKGAKRYHFGRNIGQEMKSTNVELVIGPREVAK